MVAVARKDANASTSRARQYLPPRYDAEEVGTSCGTVPVSRPGKPPSRCVTCAQLQAVSWESCGSREPP